jgi:hypothetical protein
MSLIHHQSCECFDTGLDLFSVPPTQTAVDDGLFIEVHPLAALSAGAPIEFNISGSTSDYLDLNNTFLHVQAKIVKHNGGAIDANVEVAPVNYWMHSLFSQVDVVLNNTLISASENTYPYRAYLEALLTYGAEAKDTHLQAAGYFKDSPGHLDAVAGTDNEGRVKRENMTAASKIVDMVGRLHADIFHQERYLLNGVDVKVKLTPSKDAFNLMINDNTPGYRSLITHASLFVRKVKVNPAVSLAHEKALLKGNAKYPVKRSVIKTFSIPTGMQSHMQDNLFLKQTPTRLVIGLVDSDAFNGSIKKNPFHFQHYDLSFLCLTVDGQQVPAKPLAPNFPAKNYARAFHTSMLSLGVANKDRGTQIDYNAFGKGFTLYAFDLSPSLLDGDQFELLKSAALSLELKFRTALTSPIYVVVYAELDGVIEIDRSRQVLSDFSI